MRECDMSWLGWLVLGFALGWFFEFLIDLFYWRNACQEKQASLATRERDLEARIKRLAEDEKLSHTRQFAWDTRHRALLDDLTRRESHYAHRDGELKQREGQLGAHQSGVETRSSELFKRAEELAAREASLSGQMQEIDRKTALANAALAKLQAAHDTNK